MTSNIKQFNKSSFVITVKKQDGKIQVTDPITVKNQIYEQYVFSANDSLHLEGFRASYFTNATNINTGTLSANLFPLSGVTAGVYGNSSQIPVITVNQYGIINSISTSAVAGVTGFSYISANNTFILGTGDGTVYRATINELNNTIIDCGTY